MKRLLPTLPLRHQPPVPAAVEPLLLRRLYPQALKEAASSASPKSPHLTDVIYALFLKSGFVLDPFLAATVIHSLSRSGDFPRSRSFLADTHNPDTVTWNALISNLARAGRSRPVFESVNSLRRSGLAPDVVTLSCLIKACEFSLENEAAHGASIKLGFYPSPFLVSGLVENYAKGGEMGSAESCFEECLVVDSVVCTSMISGYVWNGEFHRGRDVFAEMRVLGLELNEICLTCVIGALIHIREGEMVHGLSVKRGLLCGCSIHLNNAIMSMYCRFGSEQNADKVFEEMLNPDVVSWTTRIGAASSGIKSLGLFKEMSSSNVEVNELTLINVLAAIKDPKLLKSAKQVQALCHKSGFFPIIPVSKSLISMYGKCGQIADSRYVFDEMVSRDTVSWNSLIAAYAENGFAHPAIVVLNQMRNVLVQPPSKYTLASILEVASKLHSPKLAMQVHSHVIKVGFVSDESMLCCLITAYGKSKGINELKMVFSEIDTINVVHINAVEATYVYSGCHDDALRFFLHVWKSNLDVDSTTLSMVLKSCSALTYLEQGRTVHSLVIKCGHHRDNFIESAIIDVYCKCGVLYEAEKVLTDMDSGNLAAWNAMMMGYAQHGHYCNTFEVFNKMPERALTPDEITYLAVLNACCHAGLVREAQAHLNSMFEVHGIRPCVEHYACVVDLLGRVGLLENAKRTIYEMPMSPDAQIWQIFLSACHVHRNVELGEVAAREILKLEPESDSAYVLLFNLYASAGMWKAAGELRKDMKEKVICKEPGSSWVQIKGTSHYFHVDEISHPENKQLCGMLKTLNVHMSKTSLSQWIFEL